MNCPTCLGTGLGVASICLLGQLKRSWILTSGVLETSAASLLFWTTWIAEFSVSFQKNAVRVCQIFASPVSFKLASFFNPAEVRM